MWCSSAGPPLQLCQEAAYYHGMLAAQLLYSMWTVLGGGARLVLLPVAQAVGVALAMIAQLLLPLWQVTYRSLCSTAHARRSRKIIF